MNLGKGLAYSALGALGGTVIWLALIMVSGWNLWLLAPVVGGAAGFGMLRGTRMKGGMQPGIGAAAITLVAIFVTRYVVVSRSVSASLRVDEMAAIQSLTDEVAADMEKRDNQVYDDNGGYTADVKARARDRWTAMTDQQRRAYMAGQQTENDQAAAVLTPLGLLLDFGIFGTICAALGVSTAFKTAGTKLEDALRERGMAGSDEEAVTVAATMREEDAASPFGASAGRWALPVQREDPEPRPLKRVAQAADEGEMERRSVA